MNLVESKRWADETFGDAQLGDKRRSARLVAMAARVARQPCGTVTGSFPSIAEREGAFRFLENHDVSASAVADAAMKATVDRCARENRLVYVAIDNSSLTLSDASEKRELGPIGGRNDSRGLHVTSALAVDEAGAAIGLVDQQWWARAGKAFPSMYAMRAAHFSEKETRFWLRSLLQTEQRMLRHASAVKRWYQLDRGADCWPVMDAALDHKLLLTVRTSNDRRVTLSNGRGSRLFDLMPRQRVLGHYDLQVPEREDRPARVARVAVRACRVTFAKKRYRDHYDELEINVVMAQEETASKDRISWTLITTHPAETFADACAVIHGYTLRWRVEEFHRAWKKGLCNVEDTQLHSQLAIIKWATILATVAARAVRLSQLVRHSPDIPAAQEFSEHEIDAAFILLKLPRDKRVTVRLGEMMELVAELGGFAHKYSDRLAGPTVIGRGLERVQTLAEGLKNLEEMR